jgi:perosamine synthetase
MTWKIPLFKIYFDEIDINNVTETIKSGQNWAIGANVEKFEHNLSEYVGSKYCTTFNSGTSALHALLIAYGIGKGDEVIVPSFTFIATANSPLFVGARPVFTDIEETTYGLDPQDVMEKITSKTKAIMPIHYGGCPCKIRELREIAQDHNLLLIEDAAESLGAMIGNEKVGTFGDAGMLSFCQNKVISTGEGGAIVTNSKVTFEKLKLIRSHGRLETSDYFSSTDIFDYITLGFNFRMSNISAALGVSQLQKVDKIIKMRRDLAGEYNRKLSQLGDKIRFNNVPTEYFQVYQLFSARMKKRDELIQYLANNGIMSKIYFSPVHTTHFYKNTLKYQINLPITQKVSSEIVSLPFYPTMSNADLDLVVTTIDQFYSRYR